MFGQMMQAPLLVSSVLQHAARYHGHTEVVSRRVEGDVHRYTYREAEVRARRLASALEKAGMAAGDRIASLAWNGYRHFELYYAVSGAGAIMHTINPRLHPDQVAWIINHADDKIVTFDLSFLPLIEGVAPHCKGVQRWIALCDPDRQPESKTGLALDNYETFLLDGDSDWRWPTFDENTACGLCYTSGTTGNPKGALYSHRSSMLHAYATSLPDAMGVSARDACLAVVPMFHVNAWGVPFSSPLNGAKLVFPGPSLDGKSIYELIEAEGVTFSVGVPTVWQGLLSYLKANDLRFSGFQRTVIGGSACPPAMIQSFREDFGVDVVHGWGMTEMSPVGTVGQLLNKHLALPKEAQHQILWKQGRALTAIDMKIVDDQGEELPWDGKSYGELLVRGPWVLESYFRGEGGDPLVTDAQGLRWFPTGDVATIDSDGYMQITDRSKDVIKSGGEWISSIDLENLAVAHPAVAQAAVIGIAHPKWDERPLLVIVKAPGAEVTREEILAFYDGKIAKWWTPDDVQFVDEIPLGATGKMLKNKLRQRFSDYKLPTTE